MTSPGADTPSSHTAEHAEGSNEQHQPPIDQSESTAQLKDQLRALTNMLDTFIRQQATSAIIDAVNPPSQTNPPSSQSKKRVIKTDAPKPYSGQGKQLDNFIYQAEKYFRLQRIDDEEDRCDAFSLLLTGSALNWWKPNEKKYTT